jgi:hypothetical protein
MFVEALVTGQSPRHLAQLVWQRIVIASRGTRVLSVEEMEGVPVRIRRGPHFDSIGRAD